MTDQPSRQSGVARAHRAAPRASPSDTARRGTIRATWRRSRRSPRRTSRLMPISLADLPANTEARLFRPAARAAAGRMGGARSLSYAADGGSRRVRRGRWRRIVAFGSRHGGDAGSRGGDQARAVRAAHAAARALSRHLAGQSPRRHGGRAPAPAGPCRTERDLRSSRGAGKGICRRSHASADAAGLRRRARCRFSTCGRTMRRGCLISSAWDSKTAGELVVLWRRPK